jgi:hypothetical protein
MTSFDDAEAAMLGDVGALRQEAQIIYHELVLPGWGSPDRHGFPRTLYGMVMNAMALIDRLSSYYAGDAWGGQTTKMRSVLEALGASPEAAAVAVPLWRHTLMHTGSPAVLVTDTATGTTYRWLLHWGEQLPRD